MKCIGLPHRLCVGRLNAPRISILSRRWGSATLTLMLLSQLAFAQPSDGCGAAPPSDPPSSLTLDGQERALISVIPEDYDPDTTHKLIFAFHGRTNSNAQVRSYYRLEHGDPSDTIFIYPGGTKDDSGRYSWWQRGDTADALRDYALFDALHERFTGEYCIDLESVFVVGHSLGATFANSLACARGDSIRAAVTLGGGVVRGQCRGRVAAMVLHNPKDNLVSIKEGERARDSYLAQDGLSDTAIEFEPRDFNCRLYGPTDAKYPVLWCPHGKDYNGRGKFYPHTWPPDAGQAVMAFLRGLPEL